jgi:transcriptional regulator with XRE-family HTH domain
MTDTRPTGHGDRWTAVVNGQRLRELRRQRGLSQVELAQLAEVSPNTVSKLERQQTTACRSRTLARLAAALGEPPSAIFPQRGGPFGLTPRHSSVVCQVSLDLFVPGDACRWP